MATPVETIKKIQDRLALSDYAGAMALVQEPLMYGWSPLHKADLIQALWQQLPEPIPGGFYSLVSAFVKAGDPYRSTIFELLGRHNSHWSWTLFCLAGDLRGPTRDFVSQEYWILLTDLLECGYGDRVLSMLRETRLPYYASGVPQWFTAVYFSNPKVTLAYLQLLQKIGESYGYDELLSILNLRYYDATFGSYLMDYPAGAELKLKYLRLLIDMASHVPTDTLLSFLQTHKEEHSGKYTRSLGEQIVVYSSNWALKELMNCYFDLLDLLIERGEAERVAVLLHQGDFFVNFMHACAKDGEWEPILRMLNMLNSLLSRGAVEAVLEILQKNGPFLFRLQTNTELQARFFDLIKPFAELIDVSDFAKFFMANSPGWLSSAHEIYAKTNIGQVLICRYKDLSLHKEYLKWLNWLIEKGAIREAFAILAQIVSYEQQIDGREVRYDVSTFEWLVMSKHTKVVEYYFDWFESLLARGYVNELLATFSVQGSAGGNGGFALVCNQSPQMINRYVKLLERCVETGKTELVKALLQQVTSAKISLNGHDFVQGVSFAHVGLQTASNKLMFAVDYLRLLKKFPLKDQIELLNIRDVSGETCWSKAYTADPDLLMAVLWPFLIDSNYSGLSYSDLVKQDGFKEKLIEGLLDKSLPEAVRNYYVFAALRQESSALYQIFHEARGLRAVDEDRKGSVLAKLKSILEESLGDTRTEILLNMPAEEIRDINADNFADKVHAIYVPAGIRGGLN